MNKFFKYFLAVIAGALVSVFILTMGFFMIISSLASSASQEVKVKDNSILVLDLNGAITERNSNDILADLTAELTGSEPSVGLNQVLKAIKQAKDDNRIKGIYLESGMPSTGYATIEEIRNALLDFRASGKFIYSFNSTDSQKGYYLATAGDKVYLNPEGMLDFQGLAGSYTFYKGLLEKLGVEVQVFKHGEFKSAVEPYILDKMSDPARLQAEVYLNSMWNHILNSISASRGLTVEELNSAASMVPVMLPGEQLLDLKLIDGLRYKDEVISELKALTNTEDNDDLNAIGVRAYSSVYLPKEKKKGLEKNKIAVIYAEGAIDDASSSGGIDSEELSRTIREARRDSSIKAIVFRINSPGGSGLGSEIIWREVKLAKETKPVVVSMGDYAASGGYYIACAADTIIAHPTTLTGSIGVFSIVPNAQKLINKIGITTDRVITNEFADFPSLDRPFNADERRIMQAYIERFYEVFLTRCADGRSVEKEAIGKIGEGRVWSGENAIGINLVDKLGGIDDAIAVAANMAGIETYRIVELPEQLSSIEQLMKSFSGNATAKIMETLLGEEYKVLKTVKSLENAYPIQARIPYEISVN